MKERGQRLAWWLTANGVGVLLVLVGLVMIGLATWAVPGREALAVALVVLGVAVLLLGAFSHRIEGPVRVSAKGLEMVVRAVTRHGKELPPTELVLAIDEALQLAEVLTAPGMMSVPAAEAIAGAAVARAGAGEKEPLSLDGRVGRADRELGPASGRRSDLDGTDSPVGERTDLPSE